MSTLSAAPDRVVNLSSSRRFCARLTRLEARNFYWAFRFLPAARRQAIYAVYAFCRLLDDIVDGDLDAELAAHGGAGGESAGTDAGTAAVIERRRRELEAMRALIDASEPSSHSIAPALHDAMRRFELPREPFHDLVDGMLMDLDGRSYSTFEDLRLYCYRAASTVGLITIQIFGRAPDDGAAAGAADRLRQEAIDLGLAMQLTNIVRDLGEDLDRGRLYLPAVELERFGVTRAALEERRMTPQIRDLLRFQVERARGCFERAAPLFTRLLPESRCCPRVLQAFYSRILDVIERRGFDVFSRRPRLSWAQKARLAAELWLHALRERRRA